MAQTPRVRGEWPWQRIAQSDFPSNPRRLGFWAPGDGLPLPPKSRTTGSATGRVPILDCAILDRHAVLNVGSCHRRQLLGECLLLFRWQEMHEAKDHTQQGIRTAVREADREQCAHRYKLALNEFRLFASRNYECYFEVGRGDGYERDSDTIDP